MTFRIYCFLFKWKFKVILALVKDVIFRWVCLITFPLVCECYLVLRWSFLETTLWRAERYKKMYVWINFLARLKNKLNLWYFSDVILSTIGTVMWTAAIIAWVVIFQTHRAEWGEIADRMSFIIPNGMA